MRPVRRVITGTNYCGPGGEGSVTGPLDAACKEHDEAYTAPYLFDYISSQTADRMFLSRISEARTLGKRQAFTKFVATRYFKTKVAANDMIGHIIDASVGQVKNLGRKRVALPSNVISNKRYATSRHLNPFMSYPKDAPRYSRTPVSFPFRSRRFFGKFTRGSRFNTFKNRTKRIYARRIATGRAFRLRRR